ncbi:MAG: 1,4-dihydroxy-2-naphthoate polyprenyltransferase [Candidatus Heimdallarchaeota archaeon]|nr:1,4-dihydroxy-2-naphthoate polyprenyltransferase [Candidatus Heimdallarchaeota archaeon]
MSGSLELTKFNVWILAIRPKTLPAALSPVLVGTATAIYDGMFSPFPAIAAMIGALLLQILSNLANDYFDFVKGLDKAEREGPKRVAASGLLSLKELRIGIMLNIFLAILDGLYLIWVGGIPILIIGLLSILFALLYSGGPYPLSSIGLGDIFVFIFFGLVAVGGTYFVQALSISSLVLLVAIPPGLLITAILVVNNYRDIETDKAVNKFTLAVFMGHKYTKIYFITLIFVSYITPIILLFTYDFSPWILLPILSAGKASKLIANMLKTNAGKVMNPTLGGIAQLGLIYSLLFSIGIVI